MDIEKNTPSVVKMGADRMAELGINHKDEPTVKLGRQFVVNAVMKGNIIELVNNRVWELYSERASALESFTTGMGGYDSGSETSKPAKKREDNILRPDFGTMGDIS